MLDCSFQEYIDLSGIDKLLYLDADTIAAGDLTDLINYNGILNASLDISLKRRLEKMDYHSILTVAYYCLIFKNG